MLNVIAWGWLVFLCVFTAVMQRLNGLLLATKKYWNSMHPSVRTRLPAPTIYQGTFDQLTRL